MATKKKTAAEIEAEKAKAAEEAAIKAEEARVKAEEDALIAQKKRIAAIDWSKYTTEQMFDMVGVDGIELYHVQPNFSRASDYDKILQDKAKQAKLQQRLDNLGLGIDVANMFSDKKEAKRQIELGERLGEQLEKPTAPKYGPRSEALKRAIAKASLMSENPNISGVLSPATQGIQDTFSQDINAANVVGGGQAGLTGALGQVASSRRNRGLSQLIPYIAQFAAQNNQQLGGLIGTDLQDQASRASYDANMYGANLGQYNLESQAAGALQASGRTNLMAARNYYNDTTKDAVGQIYTGLGKAADDYNITLDNSLKYFKGLVGNRKGMRTQNPISAPSATLSPQEIIDMQNAKFTF
jgi:hypothetical protein